MTIRRAARDTIADALDNLTVLGRTVHVPEGIPRPGDAVSPSVVVNFTGSTPTEWLFNIEVYVKASDAGAQPLFLDLLDAVDARLDAEGWGPPGETVTYASDLDALVGVFAIQYPRTDF